ncbi:MAG TPA: alpha/beta fold hydrolase [Flavobacterium sp.]|jgi:pimeloyl-ACP methyl ester carboxylesterase
MKTITLSLLLAFFANDLYSQSLPYPIIFIHGLDSGSNVWVDEGIFLATREINFGGRIDYCLNFDANNATANKDSYPTVGADIALFTDYTTLSVGDYYFLNFNIDHHGRLPSNANFTDVLSNEAAIAKQGVALKYVIQMVLLKTGRDKVILMGHSMGGLCAREYLQNSTNWQADGEHHVAKLVTMGTPHGGFTGYGLSPSIDFRSEAFRDLKASYLLSGAESVYLFGGNENYSVMNNNILFDFYNVDVNCNSVDADNTGVTGLNDKPWITDVDYAYLVGICTNCQLLQGDIEGDGIVRSENANLSNFTTQLPVPKNEFIYTSSASTVAGLHSDLPKTVLLNSQGLDEPNEYWLAYGIDATSQYKGFITTQPIGGYPYDYDDYSFGVSATASITATVINPFSTAMVAQFVNTAYTVIATSTIPANSTATLTHVLSPGQWYLEIYGTPTSVSYLDPYSFNISGTLGLTDSEIKPSAVLYPNPAVTIVYIESDRLFQTFEIYNILGQQVYFGVISGNQIDISGLTAGTYIVKLLSEGVTQISKLIKQ